LVGQRLSLTALGRNVRSEALPKHRIKRIDRLLGNAKLHQELPLWYAVLIRQLLGKTWQPVILLDWTKVGGDLYVLWAAIPFMGRALPIYAEVHPQRRLGNRRVQQRFLEMLRRILPPPWRPILVADGGFRTPFFVECDELGFDFVIRVRGRRSKAEVNSSTRVTFRKLFARAGETAQCLGKLRPYATSRACPWRMVLAPRPPSALRRRSGRLTYQRRRGVEPWLLVTTLENEPAERIVAIYATRMQIEETFRDAKNPRFGWALQHAHLHCPRRTAVLLLLATLAHVAVSLVGAAAEQLDLARRFQANTVRKKRALSIFAVGNLVLRTHYELTRCLRLALRQLKHLRTRLHELLARPTAPSRWVRKGERLAHGLFCADCGWKGAEKGWPP
jgi:hypothetical protein